MTYLVSDVIARVRRQLGDTNAAQFQDSDIIHWVNDAQRDISVQNNVLQKTGTAATTANVSQYALPTDLQTLIRVAYQGNSLVGISVEQIDEIIPSHNQTSATGYPSGTPIYYWLWAGMLNLYPAPQSSSTGDLSIDYNRIPTDVTLTTNPLDLPDTYFNAVVKYCTIQAYELDTNYYASALKGQSYQSDISALKGRSDWRPEDVYPSITAVSEYDWPGIGMI